MKILLILLALLKILAILLLVLAIIFIIVLTLILLIPIKYNIDAQKSIRLYANIEIKWLIKTIYFRYKINTECKRVILKVFGKTIYKDKTSFEDNEDDEIEEKDETEDLYDISGNQKVLKDTDDYSKHHDRDEKEIKCSQKEEKIDKQIEDILKDESKKVEDIAEEEIEENSIIEKIKYLWNYPDRQQIVDASIKLIKKIIKILFPKKVELDMEVGCDNPATTGYILALSSILTLYFGDNIKVYGNFETSVLNGKFKAEGKFTLFCVLWALLVFIFIKPIRKIIWNYLKNRRKEE